MTALLVIATLGVMVLGYFVMKRIDAFMEGGEAVDSPQGRWNSGFLVFGSPEDAALIQKEGFRCSELSAPVLPEAAYCPALFALAEKDDANLQLCHAAKCSDPGIFIIARCHSSALRGVYRDVGADCVLCEGDSLQGILSGLRGLRYEK